MPTMIGQVLKLTDKNGKPLMKVDLIDPENPLVLISPEIGKVYTCTVYVKNTSEHLCQWIRLIHVYEDVRLEPSFIEFLKPNEMVEIKITWKPFTEKGISEKIKNGKISINIQPTCTVCVET